ncbi:hypothetical protein HGD85_00280 [Rhodobacteraceae bacterium R_SAG10]|nr:hypothetical protein [Rhodobacteraceae bacterium R_SAG10]
MEISLRNIAAISAAPSLRGTSVFKLFSLYIDPILYQMDDNSRPFNGIGTKKVDFWHDLEIDENGILGTVALAVACKINGAMNGVSGSR